MDNLYFCGMYNSTLPFQKIDISKITEHINKEGELTPLLDICGFLLCQKGWAKLSINDSTYTIQQGDMYIYTSSTFINIISWSEDIEGIAFKTTIDYILPFLERVSSQKTILNIRIEPCITLTASQQENVEEMTALLDKKVELFNEMSSDASQKKLIKHELECLAEAFFTELIFYYSSGKSIDTELPNHKDKITQTFILHLFKYYRREREVKFYAGLQFLTPRYFSTIIKERTGKTALNWISGMIISNSCQMLAYSDKSIKEIAMELNFPSQSFFGKYFKQYMNCSPYKYRSLHKEQNNKK